jgi:hypothetical protein
MKKIALATVAAAALLFGAPAFTAPALAQADVKVKVKSGDHGMTKKKVVIRHGDRGYDRKKVVIKHGDRGHHYGWRNRDAGMKKKVIIKRSGEGGSSKTVIKKKTFD